MKESSCCCGGLCWKILYIAISHNCLCTLLGHWLGNGSGLFWVSWCSLGEMRVRARLQSRPSLSSWLGQLSGGHCGRDVCFCWLFFSLCCFVCEKTPRGSKSASFSSLVREFPQPVFSPIIIISGGKKRKAYQKPDTLKYISNRFALGKRWDNLMACIFN